MLKFHSKAQPFTKLITYSTFLAGLIILPTIKKKTKVWLLQIANKFDNILSETQRWKSPTRSINTEHHPLSCQTNSSYCISWVRCQGIYCFQPLLGCSVIPRCSVYSRTMSIEGDVYYFQPSLTFSVHQSQTFLGLRYSIGLICTLPPCYSQIVHRWAGKGLHFSRGVDQAVVGETKTRNEPNHMYRYCLPVSSELSTFDCRMLITSNVMSLLLWFFSSTHLV